MNFTCSLINAIKILAKLEINGGIPYIFRNFFI